MARWSGWVYSTIVCAISCGIVSQMVSDSKGKDILRLLCGIILSISLFRPITTVNFREYLDAFRQNWYEADSYIADGQKIAAMEQADSIRAACETYIMNRAKALGTEIKAAVTLTNAGVPVFAEIYGKVEANIQKQLQTVLTTELGIPKENQKWIWNQESNSS